MIEPLQANWQALSDTDVIGLLRNSEGRNSTDRALFLEAARRIEAQASAVQAEREAQSKRYEALINLISNDRCISADAAESYVSLIREMDADAIRARGNGVNAYTNHGKCRNCGGSYRVTNVDECATCCAYWPM